MFVLDNRTLRKFAAWSEALIIVDRDPDIWREDCDGRVIHWDEYGLQSTFGWHIDHIVPLAVGGPDELYNLRARHWEGNTRAGGRLRNALTDGRRQAR
jgi:hypothetical protein